MLFKFIAYRKFQLDAFVVVQAFEFLNQEFLDEVGPPHLENNATYLSANFLNRKQFDIFCVKIVPFLSFENCCSVGNKTNLR